MEASPHSNAIGIDLGTSKTTLSIWVNGHTQIILNEEEERYTPSCVCFTEEERFIGTKAQSFIGKYPWNSISGFKRFIGVNNSDPTIQTLSTTVPFKIEPTPSGSLQVCVNYRGVKKFSIEQVASILFSKLKSQAESFLKKEILCAVLSVPSTFSLPQIEALKAAASVAGLYIMNTISEGALAGTEYAWRSFDNMISKIVLFINIGGGYLDVSLCNIQNGSCFVISTSGCEIGGLDIDNALVQYCIEQFHKQTGIELRENYKALRKLRISCEDAKKVLSTITETTIDIPYLANDQDFTLDLKREKLEELCGNFFDKYKEELNNLLLNSGLTKEDINEIVLLGGVTRMPKIKALVKEIFNKDPLININADEAVANGAAIHAALLVNEMYYNGTLLNDKLSLNDVLAFDIGIQLTSEFVPILLANSSIPDKKSITLHTSSNDKIKILQRRGVKIMLITTIPIETVDELEATIEVDNIGTITISLRYINLSNEVIDYKRVLESDNILKGEQLNAIVAEEKKYKEQDYAFELAKDARNKLEDYCNKVKGTLQEELKGISEGVKSYLIQFIEQVVTWCEENPLLTQADYLNKRQKIEEAVKLVKNEKEEVTVDKIKELIS